MPDAAGAPPLGESAVALAGGVVAIVREVLGDAVVGAYLHGSAVLGGLRPSSDPRRPGGRGAPDHGAGAARDRRAAAGDLRAARLPRAGTAVELTIVRAAEVRPWHFPPTVDLLYGEWLRDEFERGSVPGPDRCRTWGRRSR